MNDDLILLASAYLDDDLSSDDRARVEADPELLAEVERMRRVRAALADVDPPSPAARESAIAAALAGAPPQARPVASLDARRRAGWLAPVAAAAVGVLAVGAVIAGLRASSGGDDDSASDADATEMPSEDGDIGSADRASTEEDAPQDEFEGTSGEAPSAAVDASASSGATSAPVTMATDESPAPEGTGGVGLPLLRSERELVEFAANGTADRYVDVPGRAHSETTAAVADCDLGDVVGTAVYRADGDDVVVDVVRDGDDVLAVDPAHCAVIARAAIE